MHSFNGKKGNAALRYGVYQAAFIASTRNIDFVEYSDARFLYSELVEGDE